MLVETAPPAATPVRAALRDTVPVGAGMLSLGVAFGVLVVQSGLAWWWTPVISGLVFAGSLEFLLLSLVTSGAPLATIAVTTLLVNSRHVFYCLTFPLHQVRGRLARLYARFALIDEAWALTSRPEAQEWPGRRVLATQLTLQGYWVGGGLIGALGGSVVPDSLQGIDFALTALFVVLCVDACRAGRDLPGGLLAVGCAALASLLAPDEVLPVAMGLYVLLLVAGSRVVAARRDARA